MLTYETNKRLYWILGVTGTVLVFAGLLLELFTNAIDDWARVMMIAGIPIAAIGEYFNSLTMEEDENGGCSWFLLLLISILWIFNIDQFTTPIIACLVISGILLIVAFVLTGKRWKKMKAREKERKEKENQES